MITVDKPMAAYLLGQLHAQLRVLHERISSTVTLPDGVSAAVFTAAGDLRELFAEYERQRDQLASVPRLLELDVWPPAQSVEQLCKALDAMLDLGDVERQGAYVTLECEVGLWNEMLAARVKVGSPSAETYVRK